MAEKRSIRAGPSQSKDVGDVRVLGFSSVASGAPAECAKHFGCVHGSSKLLGLELLLFA